MAKVFQTDEEFVAFLKYKSIPNAISSLVEDFMDKEDVYRSMFFAVHFFSSLDSLDRERFKDILWDKMKENEI